MASRTEMLHDDLSEALSEIRAVMDHWGLVDWNEYLIIRHPDKDGGYVVLANPKDKSDFDEKLVALHEAEVKIPA